MKKLNKVASNIENQIAKAIKEVERPLKGIFQFITKHKKLILTLSVIYVVFNYLFTEDGEADEECD